MTRHGPKQLSPTLKGIERLAGEAFLTIPQELRRHVANHTIVAFRAPGTVLRKGRQ